MLKEATAIAGLEFTDEEREAMVESVNRNLNRYRQLRSIRIPDNVAPPIYFRPLVPGMQVNRERLPFRTSAPPDVRRPSDLEGAAFWPVTHLAQLIRTRQVRSIELTGMYLARLRRYNDKLNCVVTFLDGLAMAQARQADAEIDSGRYKGPLHGIPWGVKDIIAVKGYRTTWGSRAFVDQIIDEDASIVEMLRDAGAVLLAKLSTGELAGGDRWFGGRTNNPWNPEQGSSGSSAGSAAATAAGCVGFSIGTETTGSLLAPSARCGLTGLRPTFGRVSRYGVMTMSWTQDRVGPMCRSVEDCALVMRAIARADGRDLSIEDIPFNWDAHADIRRLRIGYLEGAFDDGSRRPAWVRNDLETLARLRSMGLTLVPISVPDFPLDLIGLGAESATSFDEFLRSGKAGLLIRAKEIPDRANGMRVSRTIPAVEYLQAQRLRMMMMQQLGDATASVDVYLAPSTGGNLPAPETPAGTSAQDRPPNKATHHFRMANMAGYPAIALPNGLSDEATPTGILFMARPFGEAELLVVAKAYQDASSFHLKHPAL
jgi:Asp-tRNA(Asn)/Glu-tRNA(Gln) amidotransferase A subunit family amidase